MQSCVLKATEAIPYVANTLFGLKVNKDETAATNIPLQIFLCLQKLKIS